MVFHTNPCIFEIFKTVMKYVLKHHRTQISFYFIKAIRVLKCVKERFNEGLKILEFTRICMENHASVTGWQDLFISYKCFQLSAAVAIATFEIYGWNFSGYLILICSFSLCKKFFKSELFSCLPKVGHVIKTCKEPIAGFQRHATQNSSK